MVLKVEAQRQLETFAAKKPYATSTMLSFSFWLIFPSVFYKVLVISAMWLLQVSALIPKRAFNRDFCHVSTYLQAAGYPTHT